MHFHFLYIRTIMKFWLPLVFILSLSFAQAQKLTFPDSANWNVLREGKTISFKVETPEAKKPKYSLEGGNELGIQFDTLGNFQWTPSYDLVGRLDKQKEVNLIFQADWKDGRKARTPINFTILHTNRPPEVDELPVFYVKQAAANTYQISSDYVRDPDGDPLVFKSIQAQMPEGATLSSLGLLTWTPSRNQFRALKGNPLVIEFVVQDQPEKAERTGKIRIAQTQQDLPPEILLVPGDSIFTIKEDEWINLKIYVSDANGDENITNVGFVSSDTRVPKTCLKENTSVQSEFTWSPGYYFVAEVEKQKEVEITFFAIDKSNNRTQKKVKVRVQDTENLDEKDKFLYEKYRTILIQAKLLIDQLDEKHKALTRAYKQAKKGKRNRSIMNASFGATTGISPIVLPTNDSKVVSAVGGTTVLTLGTLEATEVLGKSKNDIMDQMKTDVEIRNQLQLEGDNFARKYALKLPRRAKEFDADRDKLLPIINNQKLVTLELDASRPSYKNLSSKEIKKTFTDFSEE